MRGGGSNFQHQTTNNSGYGQNTGNYQPNYGNQQQQYPQQYQNNQQHSVPQQYQPLQQYQPPPGSYINPAFGNIQPQVYPQPQIPQYGQQTGFATGQNSQPLYGNPNYANSPPGEKRTRDQAFGNSNRGHPMKKPSSAPKAQVAPSVPSFGAPLLPQKPQASTSLDGGLKQRAQPSLGLIPQPHNSHQDSDHEASEDEEEEEEVDEEATLSALQNGPLSFEFNGELSTLGSPADIAEWIAERRKRWPSKRRVEEKQLEVQSRMEERRRIEQETRAAIAVASGGEYQPVERRDERLQRQIRRPDTEGPVKQDEDSMMEAAQSTPLTSETTTQPDHNTDALLDHHSDSDSDAPPEQTSTKLSQPLRVPPPTALSKPARLLQQEAKPCTSFLAQGRCKFGNKCRYKHDSTSTSSSGQAKGRKTLFQRVSDACFFFICVDIGGRK
jgi:hypothetical protein